MGKILFQMILQKSAGTRRHDQLFFPPSAEIKPTHPKGDPPSQLVAREEGVVASDRHAVMTAKAAGIAVRLFGRSRERSVYFHTLRRQLEGIRKVPGFQRLALLRRHEVTPAMRWLSAAALLCFPPMTLISVIRG